MDVTTLVLQRFDENDVPDNSKLNVYIRTVTDRLCIRLGVDNLPERFYTICADAVVKMHRRFYYEGISSENDGGITVSFVDSVLSEYENEISDYVSGKKRVRFL